MVARQIDTISKINGSYARKMNFFSCAQMKKDSKKIVMLTELPILIPNSRAAVDGTRLAFHNKPISSWSLMALFLPAVMQYYNITATPQDS